MAQLLSKWGIDLAKVLSKNLLMLHVPARQVSRTLNGLKRAGFLKDDIVRFAEANPNILAWPANMDSLKLMKELGIETATKTSLPKGYGSPVNTPFNQLSSAVRQGKQVRRIEPELEARYIENGIRLRQQDVDLTVLSRGYSELLAEDPAVIEEKIQFLSERPLFMSTKQRAVFLTRGTSIFGSMSLDTARANLTEMSRFVPEKELGKLVEYTPLFLRPGGVQFLSTLAKFGIASANLSDLLHPPDWIKVRHRRPAEFAKVSRSEYETVLPARFLLLRHYFDHERSLDILGDVGCFLCHPRLAPGALHLRLRLLEHVGLIDEFGRESSKPGKRVASRTIAGSIKVQPPKFAQEAGITASYIYYFNLEYGRLYESKANVSARGAGDSTSTWANIGRVTKDELRKGVKSFSVWEATQSKGKGQIS